MGGGGVDTIVVCGVSKPRVQLFFVKGKLLIPICVSGSSKFVVFCKVGNFLYHTRTGEKAFVFRSAMEVESSERYGLRLS